MRVPAVLIGVSLLAGACGEHPAPPAPKPRPGTVIVLAGDIACSPSEEPDEDRCQHMATARVAEALRPTRVLPLGDLQYEDGRLEDFRRSYDTTWGRFRAITRPVPGNHDYRTGEGSGYYDYFNGPGARTGPAGPRGEGWYSWDLAGWHLIALNSNCDAVGGCHTGSPQEQWLRRDLASTRARCVLAYWHHARFSSGQHGPDEKVAPFWQALHEARADLVVAGHDHNYERFGALNAAGRPDPETGIPSFVVGTGGKSLRPKAEEFRSSQVYSDEAPGVLELRLRPTGYDWRFVPIAGERFADSGSGRCR